MSERPMRVSDHALVRYLERIKGISLDEYRVEIRGLAETYRERPPHCSGEFHAGLILTVELLGEPIITTVLGPGHRPKRKRFATHLIYVPLPIIPPDLREADGG